MKYNYVYRITNILTNKHYYGSRTSKMKPSEDLGFNYFSSSSNKSFINEQKTTPENFKYKIIKIFTNRKDALIKECFLHRKFNVGKNKNFYNKAIQTSEYFDVTGIPRSQEVKDKISSKNKGKGNGMYGKKHTKEAIQKISDRSKMKKEIVTCPNCGKKGGKNTMKRWHFDNCGKNTPKKSKCHHCTMVGNELSMKRWHFDNCKLNESSPRSIVGEYSLLYFECVWCDFKIKNKGRGRSWLIRYHNDNCKHNPLSLI